MSISPSSIGGSPQANNPLNSPLWPSQGGQSRVYAPNAFDSFQRAMTEPSIHVSRMDRIKAFIFHPIQTWAAKRKLNAIPAAAESKAARMKMYLAISSALPRDGKNNLANLLKTGVLNDTDTDDGHSTLYHLYAILTTPRAKGLTNKATLQEAVAVLNKPYTITQKFSPVSENVAREMLRVRNTPGTLNRSGSLPAGKPLTWADLNVDASATCVSSSVMYYMADKKPGELTRHLNELTSPMQAFYEKVKPSELSPDDPSQAAAMLQQNNIKYVQTGEDEFLVKVELPETGLLRAVNDSGKNPAGGQYRNGVEAAYQSALTFLSTRSYDPATDFRDSEVPGEGSKGLTEPEKTLMETIIKDNGGVGSVTYQTVAGKANPAPGEEGQSYLYGYTRSFEQTASDMVQALNMGEFVIIGITDMDPSGAIVGGHEITLTQAFVDPKDNELKFVVVDSDDDIPKPVIRSAREIIPSIHHAGLPLQLAQKINQEINASTSYLRPDQNDMANFDLKPFVNENLPPDAVPPHLQQQQAQHLAVDPAAQQQAAAQPQPQAVPQQPLHAYAQTTAAQQPAAYQQPAVSWEPVYGYNNSYTYPQYPGYAAMPSYYPTYASSNYPAYGYASYPAAPTSYAAYPQATYAQQPQQQAFTVGQYTV